MSVINKLTVENFQSHKKTEIEPAPPGQLTVITGPSDSGKTAIIRALKWVLYNRPHGNEFIRVGAKKAMVSVTLINGVVSRQRSAGVNRYEVFKGDYFEDGYTTLEGFGNEVPIEVQELTGVRQTMVGDVPLNLNLAEQLDGPFLGSIISVGARARILGKLAGTEEIDHANKLLGTDLHRRKQDRERAKARIDELQTQLEQFKGLPRLGELVEQLESLIAQARNDVERIQRLRAVRDKLHARQGQAQQWQAVLAKLAVVSEAEILAFKAGASLDLQFELTGTKGHLWNNGTLKNIAEKVLAKTAKIGEAWCLCEGVQRDSQKLAGIKKIRSQLHAAEDAKWKAEDCRDGLARKIGWAEIDLTEAAEVAPKLSELKAINKALIGAEFRADASKQMVEGAEHKLAQYTGAYKDALVEAGQCPTCGGEIDSTKIKGVV
ncbi:MAG: hypothetical protein FH749_06955 [Firmicutes bacterium]|nr:hypothetical protein [Bacillota bacterium]